MAGNAPGDMGGGMGYFPVTPGAGDVDNPYNLDHMMNYNFRGRSPLVDPLGDWPQFFNNQRQRFDPGWGLPFGKEQQENFIQKQWMERLEKQRQQDLLKHLLPQLKGDPNNAT
jgi:hypothetical protein